MVPFALCMGCCDLGVFVPQWDLCEVKDLGIEIIDDPECGVFLVIVVFRDYTLKLRIILFVSVEGT